MRKISVSDSFRDQRSLTVLLLSQSAVGKGDIQNAIIKMKFKLRTIPWENNLLIDSLQTDVNVSSTELELRSSDALTYLIAKVGCCRRARRSSSNTYLRFEIFSPKEISRCSGLFLVQGDGQLIILLSETSKLCTHQSHLHQIIDQYLIWSTPVGVRLSRI